MSNIASFEPKNQIPYVTIAERCRRGHKEAWRPGDDPDEPCSYDGFDPLLKLEIELTEKWPSSFFPGGQYPDTPEIFTALQAVERMESGLDSREAGADELANLLGWMLYLTDPSELLDDEVSTPQDIETVETIRTALAWVVEHPDEMPEDSLVVMDRMIAEMQRDGRLPGEDAQSPRPQAVTVPKPGTAPPKLQNDPFFDGRPDPPPVLTGDQMNLRIYKNTDTGNAERLVSRHGADIRYCHPQKTWYVYDGVRWAADRHGRMMSFAKDIARTLYAEAFQLNDDAARKKYGEWALRSESTEAKKRALVSAQSEKGIPVLPEEFDADGWLLNCLSGTIDLKTGELRGHRREDLITKLAPVQYDSAASSSLWQRFLDETTGGNQELQGFLQRAIGYSLTGSTAEEKLFFVHGPGGSGKSTFLEAVKAALGDYSKTADFETFVQRNQAGGVRDDVAELAGRRFVISIEVDDGKKLAEGLTKMLTGGDTVRARLLYQQGFEFLPQFKLWLAANKEPRVRHDDSAMWRRILRIPFNRELPKEKRDPTIKARLKDVRESGPAILAWAVEGCLRWQEEGLGVPALVEEATEAYRLDMDPLKDFVEDCCVAAPNSWATAKALRDAYERFCKDRGEKRPLAPKEFASCLRSRGCESDHRRAGNVWVGIGLRTEDSTPSVM